MPCLHTESHCFWGLQLFQLEEALLLSLGCLVSHLMPHLLYPWCGIYQVRCTHSLLLLTFRSCLCELFPPHLETYISSPSSSLLAFPRPLSSAPACLLLNTPVMLPFVGLEVPLCWPLSLIHLCISTTRLSAPRESLAVTLYDRMRRKVSSLESKGVCKLSRWVVGRGGQ
jgi:hypothetical protein